LVLAPLAFAPRSAPHFTTKPGVILPFAFICAVISMIPVTPY